MFCRKHSLYIILPALILAAFASCKKSELTSFEEKPMVHFYKRFDDPKKDSFLYSFAIMPPERTKDTIKLPVRISGIAADRDRTINLKPVADSTTAVEGTDYTIHSAIVRAGHYNDSIVLIVLRSPEMKTKEKRLVLEIIPSEDFDPGLYNTPSGDGVVKLTGGSVRMLVRINDFLTKPSNWDSWLVYFFGDYSQVKYRFIIDVIGTGEFPSGPTGLPYGQFVAYQQLMKQELDKYEAEHGNMIDENGDIVEF